jgi:acyl-CoA thioester hydrolase
MSAPPDEDGFVSPELARVFAAPAEDVDLLGHVSNIAYVRWIQEIAGAHSRAVGWDYEAYRRLGAVFVVRRHEIDYLAPVYAGESIRLSTRIRTWSAATSVRATEIVKVAEGRVAARCATTWALVSIESGRPRRVPREIQEAFARAVPPEA